MTSKGLKLPAERYFKDLTTALETFNSLVGVLKTGKDILEARGLAGLIVNLAVGRGKPGEPIEAVEAVKRTMRYAHEYLACSRAAGMPKAHLLQMRGSLDSISADTLRDPPSQTPAEHAPATGTSSNGSLTPMKFAVALATAALAVGLVYHYSSPAQRGGPGALPTGFPNIPAGTYDLSACVAVGAGSYHANNCTNEGVASGQASAIAQTIANTDLCAGISGADSCSEHYTGFNGSEFDVLIGVTSCTDGDCSAGNIVLRVQKAP